MDDLTIPFNHAERSVGKALGFSSDKEMIDYTLELNKAMFGEADSSNMSTSMAVETVRNECLASEKALRCMCFQLLMNIQANNGRK